MSIDQEKLETLQALLTAVNNSITKKEFAVSFKSVYDFVKTIKEHNKTELEDIKGQFKLLANSLKGSSNQEISELKSVVNTTMQDCMAEMRVEHAAKMESVDRHMATVRSGINGMDGKDADEVKIVEEVLKKIPAVELDDPQELVAKLETLTGDKRLDASAIKNLPIGGKGGGGAKSLRWLIDITNAHEATDGQILVANGDKTYSFEDAGAGSGVDTANNPNANEFARFTDADTIEGLTAAEMKAALDLEIGTDIQAYSANLDEYAAVNPTAAGLALLDDANAAAQLVTLGITASAAELNLLDGITVLSGSNTGDQTSIVGITGTKAEFDTAVTDGNFLYVGDVTTNATHTGEVTGATTLTVDKTAISNKSEVTAAVEDTVLIGDASDSNNLKKVTIQTIADLASGSGVSESLAIAYAVSL